MKNIRMIWILSWAHIRASKCFNREVNENVFEKLILIVLCRCAWKNSNRKTEHFYNNYNELWSHEWCQFEREGKCIRILFEVSLAYEDRILFTILARQITVVIERLTRGTGNGNLGLLGNCNGKRGVREWPYRVWCI